MLPLDAARLDCFMELAEARGGTPIVETVTEAQSPPDTGSGATIAAAPATSAVPPTPAKPPEPASAPSPGAAPTVVAAQEPLPAPVERHESGGIGASVSSAAPVPSPQPQPAAKAAPVDAMENLGLRQNSEPDVIHATVVQVEKARFGELIFHFDNGQVWRQQEKRYFPYPRDRAFDVTLSTGMMGEHRLQVEGAGRRATIKRIQ